MSADEGGELRHGTNATDHLALVPNTKQGCASTAERRKENLINPFQAELAWQIILNKLL